MSAVENQDVQPTVAEGHHESRQKTMSALAFYRRIDLINPDKRTLVGATLSLACVVGFAVYAIRAIIGLFSSPPPQNVQILWSSMLGPEPQGPRFPIELGCSAPDGCTFVWHYSGGSPRSAKCKEALPELHGSGQCMHVAYGETLANAALCYSDLPFDGLVAFHGNDSASTTTPGVYVTGVTEVPRLTQFKTPIHPGRTQLHFVQTTNATREMGMLGYQRREWFPTLLSAHLEESAVSAASLSACADVANASEVTLISLGASWTEVTVDSRFNLALALYGECGGALSLFLELATIFLLVHVTTCQAAPRVARERLRESRDSVLRSVRKRSSRWSVGVVSAASGSV